MNIAVIATLCTIVLSLVGVGIKLGKSQAQIDGLREAVKERPSAESVRSLKDELGLLREDLDRRLDEKASSEAVDALKEAINLLRQDITSRLDAMFALMRKDT